MLQNYLKIGMLPESRTTKDHPYLYHQKAEIFMKNHDHFINDQKRSLQCQNFKGIRQYIFLLFHLEELLKLYFNLFYRFCVTLLFLEIFEQKKSQISELSTILDFGGYACDIISRVTQDFIHRAIGYYEPKIIYFSNYLK